MPFHDTQLLDLSDNKIGTRGAVAVGVLVQNHSGLHCLRLAKCQLGDRAAECVIEALIANTTLTEVDLSANAIGAADP